MSTKMDLAHKCKSILTEEKWIDLIHSANRLKDKQEKYL
jgi:hypothetical protein